MSIVRPHRSCYYKGQREERVPEPYLCLVCADRELEQRKSSFVPTHEPSARPPYVPDAKNLPQRKDNPRGMNQAPFEPRPAFYEPQVEVKRVPPQHTASSKDDRPSGPTRKYYKPAYPDERVPPNVDSYSRDRRAPERTQGPQRSFVPENDGRPQGYDRRAQTTDRGPGRTSNRDEAHKGSGGPARAKEDLNITLKGGFRRAREV